MVEANQTCAGCAAASTLREQEPLRARNGSRVPTRGLQAARALPLSTLGSANSMRTALMPCMTCGRRSFSILVRTRPILHPRHPDRGRAQAGVAVHVRIGQRTLSGRPVGRLWARRGKRASQPAAPATLFKAVSAKLSGLAEGEKVIARGPSHHSCSRSDSPS